MRDTEKGDRSPFHEIILTSVRKEGSRSGGHGRILFGVDLPTEPDAIESMCAIQTQHKKTFELRRFQPGRTFFHPKFSMFGRQTGIKTAIIGSSNLTGGGLNNNYETNVFVNEPRVVQQLLDYFEEHFQGAHAKRIDKRWLDDYRHLWTERKRLSNVNESYEKEFAPLEDRHRTHPDE